VATCYITSAQQLAVGPFHFTVVRILVVVGALRVSVRGEWSDPKLNRIDGLMVAWGVWLVISGLFHLDPSGELVTRLGRVFDAWGIYFLVRLLCRTTDEFVGLFRFTALLLAPIAVEMLYEKLTAHNVFSIFGGVPVVPTIRDGKVRAQGPFEHAILAGTVGAVCLPLVLGLWRTHRWTAILGLLACLAIVYASTSSGPLLSALAGVSALMFWRYRRYLWAARWGAVASYIALDVVMKDPAYYILARIDLTGSSTGWHRARLIQAAIEHLSEWWLIGTDRTADWIGANYYRAEDSDITNHYIQMGVWGGLPLMLLFIALMWQAFAVLGRAPRNESGMKREHFVAWILAASLFSQAVTCVSVSYFDQSVVFLYVALAALSAYLAYRIHAPVARDLKTADVPSSAAPPVPQLPFARPPTGVGSVRGRPVPAMPATIPLAARRDRHT